MSRIILRALGLVVVIPALFVLYLFRSDLPGKEIPLLLAFSLSVLGFYLIWTIVRPIGSIRSGLEQVSRGEEPGITLGGGPTQLLEMTAIINSLNRLTADFQGNARQLERFIEQFALLTELTEVTARVPEISELLDLVLSKAMGATQARSGLIFLRRENEEGLELVATQGSEPESDRPSAFLEGLACRVIEGGHPLLIGESEQAAAEGNSPRSGTEYQGSFLIMPLKTKAGTVGAVCLTDRSRERAFSVDDKRFLAVMLGQTGYAVENARLLKYAREAAQALSMTVRHQEMQIQEAQRQILQAEKLSSLGQLAGGIAHDFNNLLQAILGYTHFAQKGLPAADRRYQDLEHVRRSAERAVALTRELLAFGRRQVLQTSDLDLSRVIKEMEIRLRGVIGMSVELEFDSDPIPAAVHVDPRQFEQVMMNLCLNSRDAMPDGGRIRIVTKRIALGDEFCAVHPWARRGDYVRLTVEDTGVGMDEATRCQIFEPFFTTKEVGRGTGLGLATVYGVVQQHEGLIDVESQVGRGTVVSIYLPALDRPLIAQPDPVDVDPPGGMETVLVAEDQDEVRAVTARMLEHAGYKVLTATDGLEALQVFDANADQIDITLLDMVMPRMGGREAAHQILQRRPGHPVLLTSAYSADVIDTRFLDDEGMDLIEKPVREADLLRKVRGLLDAARDQQQFGRNAA